MDQLFKVVDTINSFIWGPPMIFLILGLGIYLTFKIGFIQRYLFKAIKMSVAKDHAAGEISNFGALAINIAATVGTGSIIGVTTAVAEGGPGAVFWMIVAAIFGFTTKYAESFIAIKHRVQLDTGEYVGGPMYVLKNALNLKWVAIVFAIGTFMLAFTGGSSLQTNSIADALREGYNINPWVSAVIVTVLTAMVTLGGVKRIAAYCEWLVPIMGSCYLLATTVIIFMHIEALPEAVATIFKTAFTGKAALGGAIGFGVMAVVKSMMAGMLSSLKAGIARSVLATEQALGTSSIVSAAAQTTSPAKQAFVAATSVFWAILICTMTGLLITVAGDWQNPAMYAANLCNSAFKSLPYVGTPVLVFSLSIFSFTTIVGWCYYGEKVIQFLEGEKWVMPFRIAYIAIVFCGGIIGVKFVPSLFMSQADSLAFASGKTVPFMWQIAIFAMTFMTVPNIYAIWRLRNEIKEGTRHFINAKFKAEENKK
ncbi:alanine or glycine:cation symporter [Parelusimicrobium proximum]|uniref:alanine/glycine:cation symporter family protein n=1 Tax=Parelusimicrobium proximum TaxID=3228953 RepID=UPI003D16298C